VRWERSDYFAGQLGKGPIQYQHVEGQFFPYVVHDVYGSKVLPENLGDIAPVTWHTYKQHLPADVLRAARANLVVRDGFAAFYYHPYLPLPPPRVPEAHDRGDQGGRLHLRQPGLALARDRR
jgi:hypothetical protein